MIGGALVAWACADGDTDDPSIFAPEAFVDKQYHPFFYDSYNRYYGGFDEPDPNTRFNDSVLADWKNYLGNQWKEADLKSLLFTADGKQIEQFRSKKGALQARDRAFFNYLALAKACEQYAIRKDDQEWIDYSQPKPKPKSQPALENRLRQAIAAEKDAFIQQRLWFQLVRYYYFHDPSGIKTKDAFARYEKQFPKNLMYYRTLGYLAGSEYAKKNYALANYHYSLCYGYTEALQFPSQWSFHPQEEADWKQTLALAKNSEEKINLWHLLGTQYQDPARAIKEIVALNPASERLDLLLGRLINMHEDEVYHADYGYEEWPIKLDLAQDTRLIESIAGRKDIRKPAFWLMAAGYLRQLGNDASAAARWYAQAEKHLAGNDQMGKAQLRLLNITLTAKQIRSLNSATENKLTESLNWLADLRDNTPESLSNLRFQRAISDVIEILANTYQSQGNLVAANYFQHNPAVYTDSAAVARVIALYENPNKTAFEKAMLRFYEVSPARLKYQQAVLATYRDNIDAAVSFASKVEKEALPQLLANPFNSRLNDCHDCEFTAAKKTMSALEFLQKLQQVKKDLAEGKDIYSAALLIGNAYYNITHYGTARVFYANGLDGFQSYQPAYYDKANRGMVTSQKLAEKYYRLAYDNATTPEQKAKAAFLLSKCERNEYFNRQIEEDVNTKMYSEDMYLPPAGNWFKTLKEQYAATNYYKDIIRECGYFRKYATGK